MKKIISIITLISLVFLTSCGKEVEVKEEKKKDFVVNVTEFNEFSTEAILNKTWKISSSQDISMSSNVSWRVWNILVRDGDTVQQWEILAVIDDTIANYGISVSRARNSLDRAKINYDSQKINLDKAVFDTNINLKKLKSNLEALKGNTDENLKNAESDLENSDYTSSDSKSALELQKLDNAVKKAELDYQNKLVADSETLQGFYSSIKKEHNAMRIFLDDVVEFTDELLWVTDRNKDKNDNIEDYLGAKDSSQKNQIKEELKTLIAYQQSTYNNFDINSVDTEEELIDALNTISKAFNLSKNLLNNFELTLNNSIESLTVLSSLDLANYQWVVNGYQAALQWNYTSFLAFDNGVKSFSRTYKQNQQSIVESIELLKKDREIAKKSILVWGDKALVWLNKVKISSEDAIRSLELQVESAKNTYDNSIKTRDVTLRSLKNGIRESELALAQSQKEYNKLTVRSPITWAISSVGIDIWQEVSPGKSLFTVQNNTDNEVEIAFSKDELSLVKVGNNASVLYDGTSLTGSIHTLSSIADSNLKYKSKVQLSKATSLLWDIVSVEVPLTLKNQLIPVNIVTVQNDGTWVISIYEEEKIKRKKIVLGKIYGNLVEVISGIEQNDKIITNYVDNFDSEKFNIKIQ